MPTYLTNQLAQINVAFSNPIGFPAVKSWSTYSGGDPQAATSQLLPGNVMPSVAQPGPVTLTNVTVTRPYTMELHAFVPTLRASLNAGMSVSYTPTDVDGNPSAITVTISGILKEVQIPNWDAKSGDTAMLGLVMECNAS